MFMHFYVIDLVLSRDRKDAITFFWFDQITNDTNTIYKNMAIYDMKRKRESKRCGPGNGNGTVSHSFCPIEIKQIDAHKFDFCV